MQCGVWCVQWIRWITSSRQTAAVLSASLQPYYKPSPRHCLQQPVLAAPPPAVWSPLPASQAWLLQLLLDLSPDLLLLLKYATSTFLSHNQLFSCIWKLAHNNRLVWWRLHSRSINKLQNDVILFIFKVWKIWNVHFVRNLIGDVSWKFYEDDFMIVTLLVFRTQPVSAVICATVFFHSLSSVKLHCALSQKWTRWTS